MKNMKKGVAFTILAGMLLMLTACGSTKIDDQPSVAAEENESKGPTGAPTNDNASRRIEPLPAAFSMNALDNCTVAASFEAENVASQEETLSIHMTIYDCELFDLVDISLMNTGDTLVIDGAEILIESVDRNETNLVSINGGFKEGGHDLYTEETGVYYEVTMDAGKNYYSVGEITLPIAADFIFTDDSDPEHQGKEYDAQGFLAELETNELIFNQTNTRVTIQDGSVTDIHRIYMP